MDLINYIALKAARRFGGTGRNFGVFNGANFSLAWSEVTGIKGGLDGYMVEAMLHGRSDVTPDGIGTGHYRLVSPPRPAIDGKGDDRG